MHRKDIQSEKEILKKRAFFVALLSGTAAAAPFPGSEWLVNVPLLINEVKLYKEQFNLDAAILNTHDEQDKDFISWHRLELNPTY